MTSPALLVCVPCANWKRHDFVRRDKVVDKDGALVVANLIFVCQAGHERVWGNEGPADARAAGRQVVTS